jgi:hypothetical protein
VQQGEPDQGTHEPAPSARLASHYACAGQWAGSCPLQPAAQGAHLRQGFEPPAAQIQVQQRVQVRAVRDARLRQRVQPQLELQPGGVGGRGKAGRQASGSDEPGMGELPATTL